MATWERLDCDGTWQPDWFVDEEYYTHQGLYKLMSIKATIRLSDEVKQMLIEATKNDNK